jgi:membrane protein DedA with SNARE-associated domain
VALAVPRSVVASARLAARAGVSLGGPLSGTLWQLFWINLITPSCPWLFPVRMALTAGAVTAAPWWAVLLVATTGGTLGMLPGYAVARWATPPGWRAQIENDPRLGRMSGWARSNMFWLQVLLTATPTPHLVSSGLAGLERYSIPLFLLAQFIGQGSHNAMIVVGGEMLARYRWFVELESLVRNPLAWLVVAAVMGIAWLVRRQRTTV